MANEIVIKVTVDGDPSQHISRIQKAADDAAKGMDNASKSAGGWSTALKTAGAAAGGFIAANVIGDAVGKVTGFIGDSIKEATKLGESLNAVNKIFGSSAQTILDWGKNNATSFGLSQQAFNQLATPLGAILKNAGFSMDETADKTIELTKRAADMASVFNTDVDQALQAIMSGLKGEANPLEAFGVGLSAAKVEAQALTETGKKQASQLTDLEKQTARYNLIMKETSATAGDFTGTSKELANATRIQQARQEELQATIGAKLVPVMLKITELKLKLVAAIADHVIPAFDAFSKYIKFVVSDGDTLNDFLADIPGPLQGIAKAIGETVLFIKQHWDTIMAVTSFMVEFLRTKIEGIGQVIGGVVEIVGSAIALVVALIHGDWSKAWSELKDIAEGFIDVFLGFMKYSFGQIPQLILDNLGEAWGVVKDLFGKMVNEIEASFNHAVELVTEGVNAIVEEITASFNHAVQIATDTWSAIKQAITDAFNATVQFITDGLNSLLQLYIDIWTRILNFYIDVWSKILQTVTDAVNAVWNVITDIFNRIVATLEQAGENILHNLTHPWEFFTQNLPGLIGDILSLVAAIPGQIVDALGDLSNLLVNAGKQVIRGLIDGIKSLVPDLLGELGGLAGKIAGAKGPPARDRQILFGAGQMIMEGLIKGINDMEDDLRRQLADVVRLIGAVAGREVFEDMSIGAPIKNYQAPRGIPQGAEAEAALANAIARGYNIAVNLNGPINFRDEAEARSSASDMGYLLVNEIESRGARL